MSEFFANGELTFDEINNLMGPTFPASIFEEKRIGVVKYKGIHFVLKLDPHVDLSSDDKFKGASLIKICLFRNKANPHAEYELLDSLVSNTYPYLPRTKIILGQGVEIHT